MAETVPVTDRRSAWFDADMIRDVRTISARTKESASEVIERLLRKPLAAELGRVLRDMTKTAEGA